MRFPMKSLSILLIAASCMVSQGASAGERGTHFSFLDASCEDPMRLAGQNRPAAPEEEQRAGNEHAGGEAHVQPREQRAQRALFTGLLLPAPVCCCSQKYGTDRPVLKKSFSFFILVV